MQTSDCRVINAAQTQGDGCQERNCGDVSAHIDENEERQSLRTFHPSYIMAMTTHFNDMSIYVVINFWSLVAACFLLGLLLVFSGRFFRIFRFFACTQARSPCPASPTPPPPHIMAEPCEIRGPLERECHSHCTKPYEEYEACTKRIVGDTTGKAHCEPQFFEYLHCVDHCVCSYTFTTLPHHNSLVLFLHFMIAGCRSIVQ
jgi:ubiquinol-cytochrome c reductase subunit 6